MANPFTASGGKVQYTPGKIKTPYGIDVDVPESEEDRILNLAHQRDLIAADLLEGDRLLDELDAVMDDQMKDFALPGGGDAARRLCGSETIDWECYKKAKELLRIAPWIAGGYDPVQATFSENSTVRVGKVLFKCSDFDPDTFFESTGNLGGLDSGDTADTENASIVPFETFEDIGKRAEQNQKNWAMRILWYDFLWGKPEVKQSFLDEQDEAEDSIDAIRTKIDELTVEAREASADGNAELAATKYQTAQDLNQMLSTSDNLPDMISEDRPTSVYHMRWEAFPASAGPLDHVINGSEVVYNAAAAWIDPKSMFTSDIDLVKDKGIPAIKIGFLLSLLVSVLSLPAKAMFIALKIRQKFLEKLKFIRKLPFGIGKKLFGMVRITVGVIFIVPALINVAFIEMCIWLAMVPKGYQTDLGTVPDDFKNEIDNMNSDLDARNLNGIDINDTPAGFVSLDCLQYAQDVINRVHNDAVQ